MSGQIAPETFIKLSREFAELDPIVASVKAYRGVETELADLDSLIADPATDADMRAMAEAERPDLMERREDLEKQLQIALLPKEPRLGGSTATASLVTGPIWSLVRSGVTRNNHLDSNTA